MPVRVVPTLDTMAGIYALPREGGPSSPRFTAYLSVVTQRAGGGLQAYNPMAGAAAAATVELLRACHAEDAVAEAAQALLERCEVDPPLELALVVAAPGMWTDRLVTEAEHRLARERNAPALVQLWAGEPRGAEDARREATAETARALVERFHGAARDVASALTREGLALALAGGRPAPLAADERRAVEEALRLAGRSTSRRDVLALAYGDPLAAALGWAPPGLPDRAGCRHATALAARRIADVGAARALREPPSLYAETASSASAGTQSSTPPSQRRP